MNSQIINFHDINLSPGEVRLDTTRMGKWEAGGSTGEMLHTCNVAVTSQKHRLEIIVTPSL
jgi:hypothetical protein